MPSRESARRFHFLREIASGGFGTVYLAKVMHADGFSRLVAVKLLKSQWTDSEEVARRMRDEARLLGQLRHRNIIDVFDLTSIDGRAAVIMEYLEAVDLRFVVREMDEEGRRIPVKAALEIGSAVASALDAAYNRPPMPGDKPLRVIHRDIKPSNVMIDDAGMTKVLDFGVARSDIDNRESHTQELQFGSVDYMAPERLFFEPETPSSDVYSLAATLYELLVLEKLGKARGRPARHAAFVADRLSFLRAHLDIGGNAATELEALLRASLEFKYEDRPTAAEFFQRSRALSRLVDDEDLVSWAERVLPPLVKKAAEAPREPNPLTDSVLTEDSVALTGSYAEALEARSPAPAVGPPAPAVREDLKHGALEELEVSEEFVPVPPTGAPAAGSTLVPFEIAGPEEWDEMPTTVDGMAAVAEPPPDPEPPRPPALADPADPFAAIPDELELDAEDLATSIASRDMREAMVAPLLADSNSKPVRSVPPLPPPAPPAARSRHLPVSALPLDGGGDNGIDEQVLPLRDDSDLETLTVTTDPPQHPEADVTDLRVERSPSAPGRAFPPPARRDPVVVVRASDLDDDEPSPPRRRRLWPFLFAAGCLGALVVGAVPVVVLALDLGGLRSGVVALLSGGPAHGPVAEAPTAEPAPDALAAEPVEEVPTGPVITFLSADPNTRKLTVRCDTGNAKGAERAHVAASAADSCTVTAIQEDRSRLTAVVGSVTAGTYQCFEGGASDCKRQ